MSVFTNLESLNGKSSRYILQKMNESKMITKPFSADIDFENHSPKYINEIEEQLGINFMDVLFPWANMHSLDEMKSFAKDNTGWFFFDQVAKEETVCLNSMDNPLTYSGGNYVIKKIPQAKGVFHTYHIQIFILNWVEMILNIIKPNKKNEVIQNPRVAKLFEDNLALRQKVMDLKFSL